MTRFFSALAGLLLALSLPAAAQGPVVVELFTSQGCSSCPPADRMLHELAGRDDVIALALHVDYWDYIGWKDSYAHPAHAERQRDYARAAHRRSIYTPQLVVNGTDTIIGAKAMELADAIASHKARPMPVDVTLTRNADTLAIAAPATTSGTYRVQMLRYTPLREVQITRGENAGRNFAYANVVEGWTEVALWDGQSPLELEVLMRGDKPVVVLIQTGQAGAIVGAARLR